MRSHPTTTASPTTIHTAYAQPVSTQDKPTARTSQPTSTQDKPTAHNAQPTPTQGKPTAHNAQPTSTQDEPTAYNAEATATQDEPTARTTWLTDTLHTIIERALTADKPDIKGALAALTMLAEQTPATHTTDIASIIRNARQRAKKGTSQED